MDKDGAKLQVADSTEEQLLELYLSLSNKDRAERFGDTRHAAQLTGVSVRTIQFWIETGMIRAIAIGNRYRVDLYSVREYLKQHISAR
jgi:excisionase family DNA binding protein